MDKLSFGDVIIDPEDKDVSIYMGKARACCATEAHDVYTYWYLPLRTTPTFGSWAQVHCYAEDGDEPVYKTDMNIKEVVQSLLDKRIIDLTTIEE